MGAVEDAPISRPINPPAAGVNLCLSGAYSRHSEGDHRGHLGSQKRDHEQAAVDTPGEQLA